MRKVRLLLWRQTKHNKTLTTTLTPYALLLATSSPLLLLVENGRSAFVLRRAAWTLSRPAPAGFRERRTAPFRVRAKRQPHAPPHPSNAPQTCGRRPRPRKPPAPRAAGHERTLRATRNPPPPHVEARNRFACLSIFKSLPTPFREMRIQCGILFRLSLRSATTLALPVSVPSLTFATKNTRALRAPQRRTEIRSRM